MSTGGREEVAVVSWNTIFNKKKGCIKKNGGCKIAPVLDKVKIMTWELYINWIDIGAKQNKRTMDLGL